MTCTSIRTVSALAGTMILLAACSSGDDYPAPSPELAEAATADMAYESVAEPFLPPHVERSERYDGEDVSPVRRVSEAPVSTFGVDVDTGAYANTRRFLTLGQTPPRDAVRTEEMVNYFRYDYPAPTSRAQPFTVSVDAAASPWNREAKLVRIGLRGYDLPRAGRPPANLVFLLDVSGSMNEPDKLPLVKTALKGLAGELGERDRVSIVVYAGAAGLVLEPTGDAGAIRAALDRLEAGGSTAGGAGLELAYATARAGYIDGGVNRVIVATDGDFNVGLTDRDALVEKIEAERDSGVTLTTLGFGTGNYNEALLEQVANHGNGNYAYIDSAREARKVLVDEMASTLFTIAKDVKIQVEFNPAAVSQYRLIGYENRALREEDFANDAVDAGDIGAGHQVTALYEVVPTGAQGWLAERRYAAGTAPQAVRAGEAAEIRLRYKLPNGTTSRLVTRTLPASALDTTHAPSGDFAFAAAVAGFGQKLRGDALLSDFGWDRIAGLATAGMGARAPFHRREFVELVRTARDTARTKG